MHDTFEPEYLDLQNTKFNKFSIAQEEFNGEYEYRCNYEVDIKYHNVNTSDKTFNARAESTSFHDKGLLSNHFKPNERPKEVRNLNTEEEFDAYVAEVSKTTKGKFHLMNILFTENVPKNIFDKAVTGTFQLNSSHKLVSLSYDYRRPTIDKIYVTYDDNTQYTVELPEKVTNESVSRVVPGWTLPYVHAYVSKWLEEDYEVTIGMLNDIFGVDLTTLKGGYIK